MLGFLCKRITLLISSFLVFTLIAHIAQHQLFQDETPINYLEFIQQILQGYLGISDITGEAVTTSLMRYLPSTLTLCFFAIILALIIGVSLGIIAAMNPKKNTSFLLILLSYLGYSVPVYWLGMLFIKWFAIDLRWLPASSELSLIYDPPVVTGFILIDILLWNNPFRLAALQNAILHMILPVATLAIFPATDILRSVNYHMRIVFRQNYIKTALARGESKYKVALTYGLRNIAPYILNSVMLQIGNIITAAIMTEIIFNWPGLGTWLINSIALQDYHAIIGGILVITGIIISTNILIEIFLFLRYPVYRKVLYENNH